MPVHHDCGFDGITFTEPSQTKTGQAADCDLKTIVKRFMLTGVLPAERPGAFEGDFTVSPQTFEEAQAAVLPFRQAWDQLSPEDKARYNNSVEEFALRQTVPEAFAKPDEGKLDEGKPVEGKTE